MGENENLKLYLTISACYLVCRAILKNRYIAVGVYSICSTNIPVIINSSIPASTFLMMDFAVLLVRPHVIRYIVIEFRTALMKMISPTGHRNPKIRASFRTQQLWNTRKHHFDVHKSFQYADTEGPLGLAWIMHIFNFCANFPRFCQLLISSQCIENQCILKVNHPCEQLFYS